jgi:hypothetical protein
VKIGVIKVSKGRVTYGKGRITHAGKNTSNTLNIYREPHYWDGTLQAIRCLVAIGGQKARDWSGHCNTVYLMIRGEAKGG